MTALGRLTASVRPRARAAKAATWGIWLGAFVVGTTTMLFARGRLGAAHIALTYLLLVLGASARGGRPLGITVAVLAFAAFDVLFIPPYATFVVADPFNWIVLLAFLITSLVAAQLLYEAQAGTDAARARAEEVDRLATLGSETIMLPRAEDALTAIADVIRLTVGVPECGVVVPRGEFVSDPYVASALIDGRTVLIGRDGATARVDAGSVESALSATIGSVAAHVPLSVHGRIVGVLRLADRDTLRLDAAQQRVLHALAYYAALGAERVRLVDEAARAETLREADRMKDALLASVSHDLRTPLTTIKALAHEIGADGDERAAVIEAEADRLSRLVSDLLDLSRLRGGALHLDPQLTAADELLESVARAVSGVPGAERVRITLDPSEALLVGRFDLVHSARALSELIVNALKYGTPDSMVDVTAVRESEWLAVTVADRGDGIPLTERERIFAPFYQSAGAASHGTGLGLNIARQLALAQCGSLKVVDREGGGNVFTLRLPAADLSAFDDPGDTDVGDVAKSL